MPNESVYDSPIIRSLLSEAAVSNQLRQLGSDDDASVPTIPTIRCQSCGSSISDSMLRGTVAPLKQQVIEVNARGFCLRCHTLTPVHVKLYGDGTVAIQRNGKWETRKPPRIAPAAAKARRLADQAAAAARPTMSRLITDSKRIAAAARQAIPPLQEQAGERAKSLAMQLTDFTRSPVVQAIQGFNLRWREKI